MANTLFSASHDAQRQRLAEVARALHQLAVDTRQEELGTLISDQREAIKEPFLFVIAGEVKAGKSSFINALLGADITAVAPDPCTDTVQQIVYGPQPETLVINPFLKKIYHPAEILKSLSVVDTPGTNTIIAHHQEITERFIPRSDLVVFVLEAKNPYRQSAWDFLELIHQDWQKKLIFVLQQADLMEPEDLEVNLQGLHKQLAQRGIQAPVFAVSAKLEQKGQRENSGFGPLTDHIRAQITGKDAVRLKLQSSLQSLRNMHTRFEPVLQAMAAQYETDRAFREEVGLSLREQEARSQRQADQLVRNLIGDYERHTLRTERELEDGLGFFTLARRAITSLFSKGDSPQAWLQDLTHRLELELTNSYSQRLSEGVEEIAESISQMARIIDLNIQQARTSL
ncbi:MAG: GTP-binding protein, partial [Bacteroidetes bacterium]